MDLDIIAHDDVLSSICEVINAILQTRAQENTPIIYSVLHKKDVFAHFHHHFRLGPFIDNILSVLDLVEPAVADMDLSTVALEQVYDHLSEILKVSLNKISLIHFDSLEFYQKESESCDQFLLAFVWLLGEYILLLYSRTSEPTTLLNYTSSYSSVYKSGYIYWEENNLKLLSGVEFNPITSPTRKKASS